jgi:hypothetical protein
VGVVIGMEGITGEEGGSRGVDMVEEEVIMVKTRITIRIRIRDREIGMMIDMSDRWTGERLKKVDGDEKRKEHRGSYTQRMGQLLTLVCSQCITPGLS